MKKISIEEIDYSLDYEGYYWYSNSDKPVLNPKLSKEVFTNLPFIIEGNFFCAEKQISLDIKNIDGHYQVFVAELNGVPEDQITKQEYLAHDLEGISKIKMIQYWRESEPDILLSGMTTLLPSWQAFAGFC